MLHRATRQIKHLSNNNCVIEAMNGTLLLVFTSNIHPSQHTCNPNAKDNENN